jgi:hypothetical protein
MGATKACNPFSSVYVASKKHDLGFSLMNQLPVAEKRFPKSEHDIAADYFALRKNHTGTKWVFSEGRNTSNSASHCDIAWASALATCAHNERRCTVGACVVYEDGSFSSIDDPNNDSLSPEARLLWSNDPRIWRRL